MMRMQNLARDLVVLKSLVLIASDDKGADSDKSHPNNDVKGFLTQVTTSMTAIKMNTFLLLC